MTNSNYPIIKTDKKGTKLFCIGGGLSGISQAIKNQKYYDETYIIESTQSIGGLIKSICIDNKNYPLGAHFLRQTNIKYIDEVLYSTNDSWLKLPFMKNGSTSYGKLQTSTGYLDIKHSDRAAKFYFYKQICENLIGKYLHIVGKRKVTRSEYDIIKNRFGKLIADDFNKLSFKYYGINLEEQLPGSLAPLACTDRVKAFTSLTTKLLKKIDLLDDVLCFHSSKDGSVPYSNFVPKSLDYSKWWANVEERLSIKGIRVIKNTKVKSYDDNRLIIERHGKSKENQEIKLRSCDKVIDTVRVRKGALVRKSQTILLFLECSEEAQVDSYFVTSYTATDVFSRITFCGNIGGNHNGIVVEIVIPAETDFDEKKIEHELQNQLKHYNMIGESAKINIIKSINLKAGGFQPRLKLNIREMNKPGIAGGNKWTMEEIVNE